ncbi:MAG: hypothetical protein NVSMB25_03200 [Thermoleophilaceae bacterium]
MSTGEYLAGALYAIGTWGAVLVAAAIVVRHRLAHLRGADAAVAYGVVASALLLLVHVLPAALGLLSRTAVLVLALGVLVLAARRRPAGSCRATAAERDARSALGLGALAIAIFAAATLSAVSRRYGQPAVGLDTLNFHLPGVASWAQTGSLWQVRQFTPDLANANYPNNGDIFFLASSLPWRNDFLVRFATLPFLGLCGTSVYALGRELGARAADAAIFAVLFLALPNVADDTFVNTLPDIVLAATFPAGALFLLRHARSHETGDLVLAGVALGIAFGTKWFGVTSVVALLTLWALLTYLAERAPRRLAREGLVVCALVALAGGIWLLRNAVISGSPLFPARLSLFGLTLFDAPRDQVREIAGRTIASYATDAHAWSAYFIPAWRAALGLGGALLAAATVLAVALAGRGRRRSPAVLATTIAVVLLALVYAATPYSAFGDGRQPIFTEFNVRYAEPALVLAAALAAWVAGCLPRPARLIAELAALVAIVEGLHRGSGLRLGARPLIAAAVLALLVVALPRLVRRRPHTRTLAAVGIVVAIAAVVYGAGLEHRVNSRRYAGDDPALAWLSEHAPGGRRIGLAGYWGPGTISPVYPSFGPRWRNRVAYVGPVERGLLRSYATREPFLAGLRAGRYDLLVVGQLKSGLPGAPQAPQFEQWVSSAGWRRLTASPALTLWTAPRSAQARACGRESPGPTAAQRCGGARQL